MKFLKTITTLALAVAAFTAAPAHAALESFVGKPIYITQTNAGTGIRFFLRQTYDNYVYDVRLNVTGSITQRQVDKCELLVVNGLPAYLTSKGQTVYVGLFGNVQSSSLTGMPINGADAQRIVYLDSLHYCESQ